MAERRRECFVGTLIPAPTVSASGLGDIKTAETKCRSTRRAAEVVSARSFLGAPLSKKWTNSSTNRNARKVTFRIAAEASSVAADAATVSSIPPSTPPPAIDIPIADVQTEVIADGTTVLRSRTFDRLKFEIEFSLKKGTTDNSYLVRADKTALIGVPFDPFADKFLDQIEQWRLTGRFFEMSYVVIGHIGPGRARTLKRFLEKYPDVIVICSNPAAIALRSFLPDTPMNIEVVRLAAESIDLGQGHVLKFLPLPTPRWPDALCVYDERTKILYSDKFFGAHICTDDVFDTLGWETLLEDRRFYFDCLMAPNSRQVASLLEKIDGAIPDPVMLAPAHGPIIRDGVVELERMYNYWANNQNQSDLMVAVIYASAYGNTAAIANAIAHGITKTGTRVESINCEHADPDSVREAVERCSGLVIGSPTLAGHVPTPVQTALGIILASAKQGLPAGVFGSFGWSGEAVDYLEEKLKNAGLKLLFDPIKVKFKPDTATLHTCEETGTDFAQFIRKQKAKEAPRKQLLTAASQVEQAVGRVVGSLSVVTARDDDVSGAMLASWVSQASFTPPGLTVAVAKERAIESMLYVGAPFVINVLGENSYTPIMKHLLKPYAPGQDRFAGLNVKVSADTGCAILEDSIAYLECRVVRRMECGDHWLIYGTVDHGNVMNAEEKTAVHHRKTGTQY